MPSKLLLSQLMLTAGVLLAEPGPPPAFVPWPHDYQAQRGSCVIGNGGRINWDGGYDGNWVAYLTPQGPARAKINTDGTLDPR